MSNSELYFPSALEWRKWLDKNHSKSDGIDLIFYKVSSKMPSMRWEDAVKVALCYGWIDSKVQKIDNERRKQYFTKRKPKSTWSKLNKSYIHILTEKRLMNPCGLEIVETAKLDGSWYLLDDVDKLIIPTDLKKAFDDNIIAFNNYQNFAPSYRRAYLYWLIQAKKEGTRNKRIDEIIRLCSLNKKTR